MKLEDRKKKVAYCEDGLDNAMRKLSLATTVVKRWRARLRTQQRALQREMEERVSKPVEATTYRRFR